MMKPFNSSLPTLPTRMDKLTEQLSLKLCCVHLSTSLGSLPFLAKPGPLKPSSLPCLELLVLYLIRRWSLCWPLTTEEPQLSSPLLASWVCLSVSSFPSNTKMNRSTQLPKMKHIRQTVSQCQFLWWGLWLCVPCSPLLPWIQLPPLVWLQIHTSTLYPWTSFWQLQAVSFLRWEFHASSMGTYLPET